METSGSMTCLVVLSVFLLLCVSEFVCLDLHSISMSQNLEKGPRRDADALRYWFLDVS